MPDSTQSNSLPRALIGACAVSFAVLIFFYFVDRPTTVPLKYAITTAEYLTSFASTPPADAPGWQPTAVPGGPPLEEVKPFRSVWYRADLPDQLSALDEPLAFYAVIPRSNIAAYIGDTQIGSGGAMQPPLPFYNRHLLFRFDASLIEASASAPPQLYYRVVHEVHRATSPDVFVGPLSAFDATYDHIQLWGLWIPAAIVAMMGTLALLLLCLYVLRPSESALGIYAAIITIWALQICHGLTQHPPYSFLYWYVTEYLLGWWILLMPMFVHRFFSLSRPAVERAVWISGGIATSIMLAAAAALPAMQVYALADFGWLTFQQGWAVYVLWQYVRLVRSRGGFEATGMFILGASTFIIGIRDVLFLLEADVPGNTFYVQYVAAIQMVFFTMLLARRFVASIRATEELNRSLEQRVEEKSDELASNYARMQNLEKERTLAEERSRLMQDMHDGLGGQLVQALALSEQEGASPRLRNALDDALMDLRMVIDSLSPDEHDLEGLLAAYRQRVDRTIEPVGFRLHWHMQNVPALDLGPERALNILRILQEAVTNAVKHSGASELTIEARGNRREATIVVADNGDGFNAEQLKSGNGLRNMRNRAAKIGGDINVTSTLLGTSVRLRLSYPTAVT